MLHTLPARGPDDTVNVVVESPRGSALKLKYEPSSGAFTLSRPLITGLTYPYDWGFVPSTRAADGRLVERAPGEADSRVRSRLHVRDALW